MNESGRADGERDHATPVGHQQRDLQADRDDGEAPVADGTSDADDGTLMDNEGFVPL